MKNFLIASALIFMSSQAVAAETWIARCNNLQFNFMREAKQFLVYFSTSTGIYQMAVGKITFDNGTVLRGPINSNSSGFGGGNLTEIGLNPSRKLVYVLYRNPTTGAYTSGDFCSTTIAIQ